MRIKKSQYYVTAETPGISGFQRWGEWEYRIITGLRASGRRGNVIGVWCPQEDESYRIEDGHLPDHQPIGSRVDVVHFLALNPYQSATPIGKALDRIAARHTGKE